MVMFSNQLCFLLINLKDVFFLPVFNSHTVRQDKKRNPASYTLRLYTTTLQQQVTWFWIIFISLMTKCQLTHLFSTTESNLALQLRLIAGSASLCFTILY